MYIVLLHSALMIPGVGLALTSERHFDLEMGKRNIKKKTIISGIINKTTNSET